MRPARAAESTAAGPTDVSVTIAPRQATAAASNVTGSMFADATRQVGGLMETGMVSHYYLYLTSPRWCACNDALTATPTSPYLISLHANPSHLAATLSSWPPPYHLASSASLTCLGLTKPLTSL